MAKISDIISSYSPIVKGIIHVGAHEGQEVNDYLSLTDNIMLWEPIPSLSNKLAETWPEVSVIQAAAWCKEEVINFYVTSFSEGSSPMKPIEHEIIDHISVQGKRLDKVDKDNLFNILVIDTQGSELEVLNGANLNFYDLIIVETNSRKRYEGSPIRDDVVNFLSDTHLLVEHSYHSEDKVIADSVFIRKSIRTVIIAAGGKGMRWNKHLGIEKFNVKIDDEKIINRTFKQFKNQGDIPIILFKGKEKYGDLDKIYSSRDMWNNKGRTIILFGDTYFTDEAVEKISNYPHPGFIVFGRIEPSVFTGKNYGELFAISFYDNDIEKIEKAIERITKLEERNVVHSANVWALYRAMQKFPDDLMNDHYAGKDVVIIHDWTEDFDWPQDYDRFMDRRNKK